MPSLVKISGLNSSRKLGPRHGPARSPNNSSRSYAPTHEIDTELANEKTEKNWRKSEEKDSVK